MCGKRSCSFYSIAVLKKLCPDNQLTILGHGYLEGILKYEKTRKGYRNTIKDIKKELITDDEFNAFVRLYIGISSLDLEYMHKVQDVIDVFPVKDAFMDDRPTAFVIGTNDLRQIAMKAIPKVMEIGCA